MSLSVAEGDVGEGGRGQGVVVGERDEATSGAKLASCTRSAAFVYGARLLRAQHGELEVAGGVGVRHQEAVITGRQVERRAARIRVGVGR